MANKTIRVAILIVAEIIMGCDITTSVKILNDTPYPITIKANNTIKETISPENTFTFGFIGPVNRKDGEDVLARIVREYFDNGFDIYYLEEHYLLSSDILATLLANVAEFDDKGVFYLNVSEVFSILQQAQE
jgi:hypothetical protein